MKKLRKSSTRVTLVLIGVAALAGCGDDDRRDVYASREDCLADWGAKPEDCTPSIDPKHAGRGFFLGPVYAYRSMGSGSAWTGRSSSSSSSSSRSIGSSSYSSGSRSVSRGGFGGSARSSSS